MNGQTISPPSHAPLIPATHTKQMKSTVKRVVEVDAILFQNARQRFARSMAVRPAMDQQAKLNHILEQIRQRDPQFTQAELVRTAIQYFTDAWDLEHAPLETQK